ncbi:MAG: nitroreductase family protein [Halioglobus sp.]
MTKLNLSADQVLTTTRAVRKRMDFDRAVESDVIEECLQIALQAPSGSNSQGWHFVVVTDEDKKAQIARYYQASFAEYERGPGQPTKIHTDDPSMKDIQERVLGSAQFLSANMARVPAMLIPCAAGRLDDPELPFPHAAGAYGSIIPAVWSFMLAARERGIGTCWTTLHLNYEKEIAAILDIPADYTQIALIPLAYTKGTDFKVAPRKPLADILHKNRW